MNRYWLTLLVAFTVLPAGFGCNGETADKRPLTGGDPVAIESPSESTSDAPPASTPPGESSMGIAPHVDPAEFAAHITNPHLPFNPGTTFTMEGDTQEGDETVQVTVQTGTRTVMGVQCTQVQTSEYISGQIVEQSVDSYAQHINGDVWHFGQSRKNFERGIVVSTTGSWAAGVDGAWPGIVMKADPRVGDSYRQEYQPGVAEDMAEVVAIDVLVTLTTGARYSCVMTREWNTLEPGFEEFKYYAPGVGLVLETDAEKSLALELVKRTET